MKYYAISEKELEDVISGERFTFDPVKAWERPLKEFYAGNDEGADARNIIRSNKPNGFYVVATGIKDSDHDIPIFIGLKED